MATNKVLKYYPTCGHKMVLKTHKQKVLYDPQTAAPIQPVLEYCIYFGGCRYSLDDHDSGHYNKIALDKPPHPC